MTHEIYGSISVKGFSNQDDLERLCLLFAHDVLDWINEGGLPPAGCKGGGFLQRETPRVALLCRHRLPRR